MKASASQPSQSRRFRRDCSPTGRAKRVEKVLNICRHSEPVRNEQLKACVLLAAEAFRAEKPTSQTRLRRASSSCALRACTPQAATISIPFRGAKRALFPTALAHNAPHQSRPFGPRLLTNYGIAATGSYTRLDSLRDAPPPGEAILQAGVDICRNGLNVLLDGFVAVFQGYLHLADGIEHRGMVLGKLLADVWQA